MNKDENLHQLLDSYLEPDSVENGDEHQDEGPNGEKRQFVRRRSEWHGVLVHKENQFDDIVISNVSRGGAMIASQYRIEPNEKIMLNFTVTVDDLSHIFTIEGIVKYLLEDEEENDNKMGIAFTHVNPNDAQFLDAFANKLVT